MGTKIFKLKEMRDVQGREFRGPERDAEGNPVREMVKDADGKPLLQVPRDARGLPVPDAQPEPVYRIKTRVLGKDSLPEILKGLFLNIPSDRLTRQDTIYGTRLFQSLGACNNGTLEIEDDVHDWIKEKLKDENVGLKIFGVDLYVVEQALDDYERLHVKSDSKKE